MAKNFLDSFILSETVKKISFKPLKKKKLKYPHFCKTKPDLYKGGDSVVHN